MLNAFGGAADADSLLFAHTRSTYPHQHPHTNPNHYPHANANVGAFAHVHAHTAAGVVDCFGQ